MCLPILYMGSPLVPLIFINGGVSSIIPMDTYIHLPVYMYSFIFIPTKTVKEGKVRGMGVRIEI